MPPMKNTNTTLVEQQPAFADPLTQPSGPPPTKSSQSDLYQLFERNRIEMIIKDINLDFVDQVEIKTSEHTATLEYTAGVSVIVKLTYDNYNSHEQLGYGISKSDSRGKAVLLAKQVAIDDAANRCTKMFGDIQKWHPFLISKRR